MNFSRKLLMIGLRIKNSYDDFVEAVICLIRILIESEWPNNFYYKKKVIAYVLGTGPSLSYDIKLLPSRAYSDAIIFCVNDFYKSNYFLTTCPDHYVIADPDYWDDLLFDAVSKSLVESLSSVDWKLVLWLPIGAKGSKFDRELRYTRTRINYYNKTPLAGSPFVSLTLFRLRLAMPRPQNVLIAAISIAIWIGAKEINLLGADHDWHKDIALSPDNILQMRNNHVYHGEADYKPFYKPSRGLDNEVGAVFTVSEIFHAWAMVHRSYEHLQVLSKKCGVKIFNCGSSSFVDAFERKKFN